jgi:hypothetical protein
MPARDCPFSARPASYALLFLLGQLGCSPKYELLRTLEESGGGSAAGNPSVTAGTTSLGGTDFGGSSASSGSDAGGFTSAGTGYAGGGGCGSGGGNGLGEACTTPCANGFQPLRLVRNGCAICECVPPSECSSNADCQNGDICYAGAQCEEGCSDATCCFGNQCSRPGCGGDLPTLCLAFGCSNGDSCLAACDATSCECDGVGWVCESTTGGAPVASCPQACAPP